MSLSEDLPPAVPAPTAEPGAEPASEPSTETADRRSRWARAVERRVPQILGLYAGAATSGVLFAEFLVTRYALSPYLVDALLLLALLATPAVAALAYWHGAPGHQRWTRTQALVLGGNAVVAAGALALAFWGKPLGATTETVTVETADGETVERTVAKAAFRKRLVVSDFAGEFGRAATYALARDLGQDLFLTVYGPRSLRRPLREAGFETLIDAPTALLRDAASDLLVDRLLTGRVEQTDLGFRVEARLHALSGADAGDTYRVEGPDLLRVLDDLTTRIRGDLDLPETHLAEAENRSVEDLLTGSTAALAAYAEGHHATNFLDDPAAALAHFERALALDSTFAQASIARAGVLSQFSREGEAQRAYEAAQRHRYRLPEPERFMLDATLAYYEQRPDDGLKTLRRWAALYPDDVRALETLASALRSADEPDEAVALYERLVELDPANPLRRYTLASIYNTEERYEDAAREINAYLEVEPDDADGYALKSYVLRNQGDLDAALEASREATRLDPSDLRFALYLGSTLMYAGAWDEAQAAYRRAAERATEARDRATALNALAHVYDVQGRYREAAETLDRVWEIMAAYTPPTQLAVNQLAEGYHYTRAGRTDVFEDILRRTLAQPEVRESGAYRASVAYSAAFAYAQTGRTDEVLRYTATADSLLRAYGNENTLPFVRAIRGIGYFNGNDWNRAIRAMTPHAEKNPTDFYRVLPLARAHLAAGNRDEARRVAEGILVAFPASPDANLILATLSQRRPAEARRYLDTALAAWERADADFAPAREARALQARLG